MKNKRGWIRIVEATFAILLISGVLLTLVSKGYIGKEDISKKVRDIQISVLREIELNNSLRNEIINYDGSNYPSSVQNKINERMPDYLECYSEICNLDDNICSLKQIDYPQKKDIYSEAVAITTNSTVYLPKKLRMFCWTI